ncbi:hypothetical protein [Erythrobacter ani]|uniref:Uncharacterized protein n=1 Tax=Erythrobacter ani TaxID=2827235 RepID=A0ABS6SJH7_9SPHN|nr:hypothetical protein [Erythrobacter ani]MBV7265141.1 hypothetical protein [Erythrobacter ani]
MFDEPFITALGDQLVPDDNRTFFLVAKVSREGELLVNVNENGTADLRWVIDRNGQFFEMNSLGILPKTIPQRLGITRQKERFRIGAPRAIKVRELKSLFANTRDRFAEAPFAAQAKRFLRDFPEERVIDADVMNVLLGEEEW